MKTEQKRLLQTIQSLEREIKERNEKGDKLIKKNEKMTEEILKLKEDREVLKTTNDTSSSAN